MVTRVNTKPTRTAKAAAQAVQPEVVEPKTAFEEMMASIDAARERYFDVVGAPTWQRTLTSFLIGAISGLATMYYGMSLVAYITAAVTLLSGPGFISFVVTMLGMIAVGAGAVGVYSVVSSAVSRINLTSIKARFFKEQQHA